MLSIHDEPDAADHDVAHLAVVSGKEKRIQDVVPLPSRQIDMVAVEHDQISAFSRLQRARGLGQRLRTANRGGAPQCRFDLQGVDYSHQCAACQPTLSVTLNASVAADADGSGATLRCVSPAVRLTGLQMLAGLGGEVPVSLSLNGQQFALQPMPLKVYSHPAPA